MHLLSIAIAAQGNRWLTQYLLLDLEGAGLAPGYGRVHERAGLAGDREGAGLAGARSIERQGQRTASRRSVGD